MDFTKKEKEQHRAVIQVIIDRVNQLHDELTVKAPEDTTLASLISNVIFPPEVCYQQATFCGKLRSAGFDTNEDNCLREGCPFAGRCHEFVADMWRGGRAILFLLGRGGYKSNESRLGRCRECLLFDECEQVKGTEKIRYCSEMMYRKGLEAQAFADKNLG